jgi:hypothetical protein
MRRFSALALSLLVAACASTPQAPVVEQTPQPQQPSNDRRLLYGASAQDLVGRFGHPALQVREGTSLKLQFRGRRCVLDAYLYPSAGGTLRVTHVDTRAPSGSDTDQAACIAELETPS